MKKLIIGVDPGRKTGVAILEIDGNNCTILLYSLCAYRAMKMAESYSSHSEVRPLLRVEDPHTSGGPQIRKQGAGHVKARFRDWEDAFSNSPDYFTFEAVSLRSVSKFLKMKLPQWHRLIPEMPEKLPKGGYAQWQHALDALAQIFHLIPRQSNIKVIFRH